MLWQQPSCPEREFLSPERQLLHSTGAPGEHGLSSAIPGSRNPISWEGCARLLKQLSATHRLISWRACVPGACIPAPCPCGRCCSGTGRGAAQRASSRVTAQLRSVTTAATGPSRAGASCWLGCAACPGFQFVLGAGRLCC